MSEFEVLGGGGPEMGITSKIRESYLERLSSKAAERQQRRPGTSAAGASSGISDGKGDVAFAAVLVLVCVAALYPALYYGVSSQNKTSSLKLGLGDSSE